MFLTPVNELPARNAKHRLQDFIEEFVKSDYDIGFVNFTDLDYKSAKVCYSCLHTAVKRSKAFVKVHIRGENVYLTKHAPDFLTKTFHIPEVTDENY